MEVQKLGRKLLSYRGYVFPESSQDSLTPEYLHGLKTFQIRDDDVYVVTFPKSGKRRTLLYHTHTHTLNIF